jgi:hypothetical protein
MTFLRMSPSFFFRWCLVNAATRPYGFSMSGNDLLGVGNNFVPFRIQCERDLI